MDKEIRIVLDGDDRKAGEELIKEMIDDPGEYNAFATFIQEFNGFDVSLEEKVEEAKN